MHKVRHRGVCKVHWIFAFTCAAYNLIRMRSLHSRSFSRVNRGHHVSTRSLGSSPEAGKIPTIDLFDAVNDENRKTKTCCESIFQQPAKRPSSFIPARRSHMLDRFVSFSFGEFFQLLSPAGFVPRVFSQDSGRPRSSKRSHVVEFGKQ